MKKNYIKNFFGHLYTITHHRHLVIRHAFRCGIGFRALTHDLSKYSCAEFWPGVKYYLGTKSPTLSERLDKGMSKAYRENLILCDDCYADNLSMVSNDRNNTLNFFREDGPQENIFFFCPIKNQQSQI